MHEQLKYIGQDRVERQGLFVGKDEKKLHTLGGQGLTLNYNHFLKPINDTDDFSFVIC